MAMTRVRDGQVDAAGDPTLAAAASLLEAGRPDAAWAVCQPALEAGIRAPDWLALSGRVLLALDRPVEAEPLLALAAGTTTGVTQAAALGLFTLWGVALRRLGRVAQAEQVLRMAIRLSPNDALCHSNLAAVLRVLGRLADAEAAVRRALALDPDLVNGHVNLASIRLARQDPAGALAAAGQALARDPAQADALYTRAAALQMRNDLTGAADAWDDGVRACPGDPRLVFGQANLNLNRGRLDQAWPGYEARFAAEPQHFRPAPALPRWTGGRVAEGPLLIWREQGLGDELMFASCYADAVAAAGSAIIRCDPRLVGLFGRAFPGAQAVAEARGVTTVPDPAEGRAVAQVPAGSLPGLLRSRLATFGREGAGFLSARPDLADHWRDRLAALDEDGAPTLKVGLCWRSGLVVESRDGRYTTLADWRPLLTLPGVTVVTLQYGDTAAERAALGDAAPHHFPDLDQRDDLEGLSALLSTLDLVITVPTATGELAAALGVPVWRLAGHLDVTSLGTGARPWFPSMRVFNSGGQTQASLVGRVVAALSSQA
ncbi:MAG: tetratricopeptide repeat protein [Azospirillaceae bacterium]|nr:tetratricopeptide repeat protein [Azospirillaceae bacterium]